MSQSSDADLVSSAPASQESGADRPSLSRLKGIAPALLGATIFTCGLGFIQKLPCRSVSFDFIPTVRNACYTDIYPLYYGRGLADGKVPYFDKIKEPVEYPVLTGWFMQVVNSVVRFFVSPGGSGDSVIASRALSFFDLTSLCIVLFALFAVMATAYVAGRRSLKAGLMVALAPGLLFAAYINWDMLAVALTAVGIAFWAYRKPAVAGIFLGLAIAAKFYPVVLLWPLVLLCVRAGQWRAMWRMLAGTAGSWLVINVPVMLFAWDGWVRFYTYSQERGVDWGSFYYWGMLKQHWTFAEHTDSLNRVAEVLLVLLALGIGALILAAPRRPRLAQVFFLMLAAFMLTNKVWSPQYVLWLLPFVALARPRLPAYLLWQAGELVYFFGIWWYLMSLTLQVPGSGIGRTLVAIAHLEAPPSGVSMNVYWVALFARLLTVAVLMALVVVDILRPSRDIVRLDGVDDPAGGVLDGAPDAFRLTGPVRTAFA